MNNLFRDIIPLRFHEGTTIIVPYEGTTMKKTEPHIRIMSIDPGLNALGVSLGYYYHQKNKLVIQEYTTIYSNDKTKKEKKCACVSKTQECY